MKIGILTSSRADYGIYVPLLRELSKDSYFNVNIIAFGTHLSVSHGNTITEIESEKFGEIISIQTPVTDLGASEIAKAYAGTVRKFAEFWSENNFDLVLTLGDRYEMNAAVQAAIPFGINIAHFHGGETTLGAIDNVYRHQITIASKYHFTAANEFSEKVIELTGSRSGVFTIGSLSLSDLLKVKTLERNEFLKKYNLPNKPFILGTFHPETVNPEQNKFYAIEMITALSQIPDSHHTIISLPNADTNGSIFRKALLDFEATHPEKITLIESFGKTNYFTALKYAEFIIGNSSSGIIEAASFKKYVLNIGDRQKGRLQSDNIINVRFNADEIHAAIEKLITEPKTYSGINKYTQKDTIQKVIKKLREIGNGDI